MRIVRSAVSILALLGSVVLFQNFTFSTSANVTNLADATTIDNNLFLLALSAKTSPAKITQYLEAFIPATSSWSLHTSSNPDTDLFINYDDTNKSWPAYQHLVRLKQMSIAYNQADSVHFKSEKISEAVNAGLNFWFTSMTPPLMCDQAGPIRCSSAWTRNELWQQAEIGTILLLMKKKVPGNLIRTAVKDWIWDITQSQVGGSEDGWGANQVAFAKNQVLRGVLKVRINLKDDGIRDIEKAVQGPMGMKPLLLRTSAGKDGIQPDWSFRQHKMLYSIGYGSNMIGELASYQRYILKGTSLRFSESDFQGLIFSFLKGPRVMVRGPVADYGAFGRFMTQPTSSESAMGLAQVADDLAEMAPVGKYKELLLNFKDHVEGIGKPYSYIGNSHFWNADFMTHQRAEYYTSVRMSSFRNGSSENIGEEMPKGFWTGYGMNLLMRDGKEYQDILPVWDWALIPGVTAPRTVPKVDGADYYLGTFAGGVSNTQIGAATFLMKDVSNTTAYKSWFFFDDLYVALGAGISSSSNFAVNSSLSQVSLVGPIVVNGFPFNGTGEVSKGAVRSVFHNHVGYVFPVASNVVISASQRKGDWQDIRAGIKKPIPVQKDVFGLWIPHGKSPSNSSYAYIVYPDVEADELLALAAASPVQILSNSKNIQAVKHIAQKVTQAVFFVAGSLSINTSLKISVSDSALVMYHEKAQMIYLSQPPKTMTDKKTIIVTLNNPKTSASKKYTVQLPQGNNLGSTLQLSVELP